MFLPEDIIRTGLIYSIELDHGTYRLNFLMNYGTMEISNGIMITMESWRY